MSRGAGHENGIARGWQPPDAPGALCRAIPGTAATYVSNLLRAHLRALMPLPEAELP